MCHIKRHISQVSLKLDCEKIVKKILSKKNNCKNIILKQSWTQSFTLIIEFEGDVKI